MIKAEVVGMKAFKAHLGELPYDVAKEVRKAINQGALMVKSSAQLSIKRLSAGRVYVKAAAKKTKSGKFGKGSKTKIHIASKPGDPPNMDTGNLWRNIRVSTGHNILGRGYFALVRAATPYATRLEYGGRDKRGVYIAPRPFMRPALKRNVGQIQGMIKAAIRKAL